MRLLGKAYLGIDDLQAPSRRRWAVAGADQGDEGSAEEHLDDGRRSFGWQAVSSVLGPADRPVPRA
jgi:hypothetical protein